MIYLFLSSFINWFYTSASGLLVPEAVIRLVLSVSDLYGVLDISIIGIYNSLIIFVFDNTCIPMLLDRRIIYPNSICSSRPS